MLDLLGRGKLRGDARARFFFAHPVAPPETVDLHFRRGEDDDEPVEPFVQAVLDDERRLVDGGAMAGAGEGAEAGRDLFGDAGMDDAIERLALARVGEDAVAERLAIERAVGLEDAGKALGDLLQRRPAGLHYFARDLVRIDHGHAARLQHAGDRALPRADVAGQPIDTH